MMCPSDKYQKVNYEQLGKVLYEGSFQNLTDIQQMARRLLINVLLGNGDTHFKNWSMLYDKRRSPHLSPLYDVVFIAPYFENDGLALNFADTKKWNEISMTHFETWAKKVGVSWVAIKPHLIDTIAKAREFWSEQLGELPMLKAHKTVLMMHWNKLHQDFRL